MAEDVAEFRRSVAFRRKENAREKRRYRAGRSLRIERFSKDAPERPPAPGNPSEGARLYSDAHAERYPRVKEEHPEFFIGAAFARLLQNGLSSP